MVHQVLESTLEALSGQDVSQLRSDDTAHRLIESIAQASDRRAPEDSVAFLAQLRVANAVAPVDDAGTIAQLAHALGSARDATRYMSRLRFDQLDADRKSPLDAIRRAARKKPGTDKFGLASSPRWVLVPGAKRGQPAVHRFIELAERQQSLELPVAPGWSENASRQDLLSAALAVPEFEPRDVLLVQADGQAEYDALWLAGILGLPCVVVELSHDGGSGAGVQGGAPQSVGHELWKLQPITWLSVHEQGRHVSARDYVSGETYGQSHHDLAAALRHHGAASVIGRDLEQYVQENPLLPRTLRPIHDWIRRDIRRLADDGVSVCATIAERLWRSPAGSRGETAAAQLENLLLERTKSSLTPLKQSAAHAGRQQFEQQLRLRELFQANDFAGVVSALPEDPDANSTWLAEESEAALELLERLSAATRSMETLGSADGVYTGGRVVCFLHASSPQQSGGYAIRAHGIFHALKTHGVDIVPVTRPGFPKEAYGDHWRRVPSPDTVDGVEYRRLAPVVPREVGEATYMLDCVDAYKDELQRLEATAVHVRSTFLIAVPAIIAAKELGLRVVYEVSGLWELVYEAREEPRALNARSSFARYFESIAAEAADRIVTMNGSMIDVLAGRGADRNKIALAPNAVDVSSFDSGDAPSATTNDKVTIGYIGSIVDYEGLGDVVAAAEILRQRRDDFEVVVIGDGLALPPLKSAVARAKLGDTVKLRGRIPHAEVRDEYQKMGIMVYPRHSTAATDVITPLKPFEALAMRKAVVVSDVPPLQEIAGEDERALAFPSGDVHALADRLERLLDDPELRAALGDEGRRWVAAERSWEKVVQVFLSVYGDLQAG